MKVLVQLALTAIVDVEDLDSGDEGLQFENRVRIRIDHMNDQDSTLVVNPANPAYRATPQEGRDYRTIALAYIVASFAKEVEQRLAELGQPVTEKAAGVQTGVLS